MDTNSMPLLRSLAEGGKHYDDIVLLNINHDVANTYVFSSELAKKFGRVIQVGASYANSSPEDRVAFADGTYYYAKTTEGGEFELFRNDESLHIICPEFFDAMDMLSTVAVTKDCVAEVRAGKKLFVIEDGGYYSSTVQNLEVIAPILVGNIIGAVEQTTSGTRILGSLEHHSYPSFSIARSDVKMCFESIFIGQRIVEELSNFLYHTNHFLDFADVLLIGYGIFGRSVARRLDAYQCNIVACDTDPTIREAAESEGYRTCEKLTPDMFRNNAIVIGMTGARSFREAELDAFMASDAQNIYLSSGSSKDIEFRDVLDMMQGQRPSKYSFQLLEEKDYVKKIAISDGTITKTVELVADGMPVNFYRKGGISLTDKVIDLVFSELLMSAMAIIESDTLEHRMYLLGADDGKLENLDERQLVLRWFDVNGIDVSDDTLESRLCVHPCRNYLRELTYTKLNLSDYI